MAAVNQNNLSSQLEEAIKTTILADAWLGSSANVKTIETDIREKALSSEQIAEGFHPDELPAIQIKTGWDEHEEIAATTCELDVQVPVHILVVNRSDSISTCQDNLQTILDRVSALMRKQRSSDNHLGLDGAIVRSVKPVLVDHQTDNAGYWYGAGLVRMTVQVNVPAT
jgi:hypothetical protein